MSTQVCFGGWGFFLLSHEGKIKWDPSNVTWINERESLLDWEIALCCRWAGFCSCCCYYYYYTVTKVFLTTHTHRHTQLIVICCLSLRRWWHSTSISPTVLHWRCRAACPAFPPAREETNKPNETITFFFLFFFHRLLKSTSRKWSLSSFPRIIGPIEEKGNNLKHIPHKNSRSVFSGVPSLIEERIEYDVI